MNRLRLPAEWEPQAAVLLSWPHEDTDWRDMLHWAQSTFVGLVQAIAPRAEVIIVAPDVSVPLSQIPEETLRRCRCIQMPTDDTWARDFGVITTIGPDGKPIANDFQFNGWGLKFASSHDNLINSRLVECGAIDKSTYANRLSFVLEGGSIESDGEGTLLTTSECLLSPNRNGGMSKVQIDSELREYFGSEKVIWLDHGFLQGDDTDSHVDTLARFMPGHAIAYSSCDDPDDIHYEALRAMEAELRHATDCQGRPYRLVPLHIPSPIRSIAGGDRLPGTYANLLIINGAILMPTYGDAVWDKANADILAREFPDYEVVCVDCRALIEQHGSLHCVTMQLPAGLIK
ncbi:MAG: agmatine deiminase family protein [Muribaculaceae bacterium]|nr:agmatine deiminase family protein [Muribaculaceae bacterium]